MPEARSVVGEQIALSPQCGFASVEEGNCIDEETQWKKIDLLVSCQDFSVKNAREACQWQLLSNAWQSKPVLLYFFT